MWNVALFCRRHHMKFHEGGWTVQDSAALARDLPRFTGRTEAAVARVLPDQQRTRIPLLVEQALAQLGGGRVVRVTVRRIGRRTLGQWAQGLDLLPLLPGKQTIDGVVFFASGAGYHSYEDQAEA